MTNTLTYFHLLICYLYIFGSDVSIQIFCPFKKFLITDFWGFLLYSLDIREMHSTCHFRNSGLIKMYYPFVQIVGFELVDFCSDFSIYIHEGYWSIVLLYFYIVWYQSNTVPHRISQKIFFWDFLSEFCRIGTTSSLSICKIQ